MAKKTSGEKYFAILEGAERVFADVGYHRAQVSRIAREAGVADGTVYLYFENKEDILVSLFGKRMGNFIEKLKRELEQVVGAKDKIYKVIRFHFNWLGRRRQEAMVTQIELRQSNQFVREGISRIMQDYFRLLERIVEEGQQNGEISREVDPRAARKMIFGTIDEVVTCWVLSGKDYQLVEMTDKIFRLLTGGLLDN